MSNHSLALIHALGWCAVVHAELGETGRAGRALDVADELQRREPGLANYFGMSMTHVARGELLERQERWGEADEVLARGTELARRRQREVRSFLRPAHPRRVKGGLGDRGSAETMLREARQVAESCADPGVLPELVARAEGRLRLQPSRAARVPYEEVLSERELAVLRLLKSELNQREIARRSPSRSTPSRPM